MSCREAPHFTPLAFKRGGHHLAARRGRDGQLSSSRADHGGWSIGTDEGPRVPATTEATPPPQGAPDPTEIPRPAPDAVLTANRSRQCAGTGGVDLERCPRPRARP